MKTNLLARSFMLTIGLILVALAVIAVLGGIGYLFAHFGPVVGIVLIFCFFWWLIYDDLKSLERYK